MKHKSDWGENIFAFFLATAVVVILSAVGGMMWAIVWAILKVVNWAVS